MMATMITVVAAPGVTPGNFQGLYGNYVLASNNSLSVDERDLPFAQAAGFVVPAVGFSVGANGLSPQRLNTLSARNSDGSVIAAAAAAGKFGVALTAGTSFQLVSEAANSNTKTDVAILEAVLPPNYLAGANVSLIVNCAYVLGSGTVGTHSLTPSVYRNADAGTQGANICSAVQNVPAAAADLTFTLTSTSLLPGDRLMISLSLIIQDTGASNITANINSVRLA